jgi:hypothetical protein
MFSLNHPRFGEKQTFDSIDDCLLTLATTIALWANEARDNDLLMANAALSVTKYRERIISDIITYSEEN